MGTYRDAVEQRAERAGDLERTLRERRAELVRLSTEIGSLNAEWERVRAFLRPPGGTPLMVAGVASGVILVPLALAYIVTLLELLLRSR